MSDAPKGTNEAYLGDGLYVSMLSQRGVMLRAPRGEGDHWVVLDDPALQALLEYLGLEARRAR